MQEQIQRIQGKIQLRLKELSLLKKENENQQKQIDSLKQKQQEMMETLESLRQQNAILKAATGSMSEPDKKELEQNINRYLREIDKCIALLTE